jgi:DNA polymerase elongation subunit (family B)
MKVNAQMEGQTVLRNVAKLMMNSMYGRFGMHIDEEITVFATAPELDALMGVHLILSSIKIGDLNLVSYLPQAPLGEKLSGSREVRLNRPMESNVPIAGGVTAYSRMIINEFKLIALAQGLEVYYSDTDSLVLNGALPAQYIDKAKLGFLKLEHVIQEGIFVMPKVYWLKTLEGEEVLKCKGYPGHLTQAQYEALLDMSLGPRVRSIKTYPVPCSFLK